MQRTLPSSSPLQLSGGCRSGFVDYVTLQESKSMQALGLKRPAKPLFSEMKPDIDRLKKEFHENLSSFKKQ
ncbi:hypothetical protein M9435_000088 [Picochlorum sp. BPE23]|nr:hypothetical protein M9435_000088 [Picochlorum sp. BPE23]